MKILNRYVFRELLGPFFLGLVVFSFVIVPRLRVLELLVQKNVVPQEILLILFYILPTILTFSLPMATLLAILISFGRLSADNEVTAMRSSGISVQSLVRPVLAFAGAPPPEEAQISRARTERPTHRRRTAHPT